MKAVGVVFSNIHDKEIKELTSNRTLASVPFGGRFRLIDFVLSNMVNSGITKVGIITKKNYQSLMDHIGSGKYWDLSRKNGGLFVLPPFGVGESILYNSRFEAIRNSLPFLRKCDEDYVVMSDCDNVCSFDFTAALENHVETNADITVVYRKKELKNDSKPRTAFALDKSGRVTGVENSSKLSGSKNVFTNIFILSRKFLLNLVDGSEEKGISSFSRDVLTRFSEYRIFGYELTGYFASIDSLSNYYKHSLELLIKANRDMLFRNEGANIYTKVRDSAPCRIADTAGVSNSMIADGCIIEGEVKNSILFRGVKVARGALIENCIIFQDSSVGADTRLNCVVADKQSVILSNRLLSGHESQPYFISKGTII